MPHLTVISVPYENAICTEKLVMKSYVDIGDMTLAGLLRSGQSERQFEEKRIVDVRSLAKLDSRHFRTSELLRFDLVRNIHRAGEAAN